LSQRVKEDVATKTDIRTINDRLKTDLISRPEFQALNKHVHEELPTKIALDALSERVKNGAVTKEQFAALSTKVHEEIPKDIEDLWLRIQDETAPRTAVDLLTRHVTDDVAKKSDLADINARLREVALIEDVNVMKETLRQTVQSNAESKASVDRVRGDLENLHTFVHKEVSTKADLQAQQEWLLSATVPLQRENSPRDKPVVDSKPTSRTAASRELFG